MVDSLLTFPPVVEVTSQRRPIIVVDRVRDKTMQHVDMESVTDSIRAKLIKSGKFRFLDRTTDESVMREIDLEQNSGLVNKQDALQYGQQLGAEYMLTGNLTEIDQRAHGVKDVYYKFTLNLKNLKTGVLEWSDEKEIRKTWKRSTFGS